MKNIFYLFLLMFLPTHSAIRDALTVMPFFNPPKVYPDIQIINKTNYNLDIEVIPKGCMRDIRKRKNFPFEGSLTINVNEIEMFLFDYKESSFDDGIPFFPPFMFANDLITIIKPELEAIKNYYKNSNVKYKVTVYLAVKQFVPGFTAEVQIEEIKI